MEDAQDAALSRFSLWWLDMSTDQTQPVFQDQSFPSTAAKFSPDGQWLSYISHVLLAEANTSYSSLVWSPDSTSIIYSRYNSQNPGKFDIYMTTIQPEKQALLVRAMTREGRRLRQARLFANQPISF